MRYAASRSVAGKYMPNAVIVGTPHITEKELMKAGAVMSILGAGFFSLSLPIGNGWLL
jgi:di/tricarboxylate transporter